MLRIVIDEGIGKFGMKKTSRIRVIWFVVGIAVVVLGCGFVGTKLLTTWQLRSLRVLAWEPDRYLWTAGMGGIVRWDVERQEIDSRNFFLDDIDHLAVTSEGQVWAYGSSGAVWAALYESGKWTKMDEAWGLPAKPKGIVETDDGRVWAATHSGFSVWNPKSRRWEPSPISQSGNTLAEGLDGTLWFGPENGVIRLSSNDLDHWTVNNGLSDNRVHSLLAASDGSIWAGTRRGVSRWKGTQWQKWPDLGYADPDGLSVYKLYETRDGTIWAATSEDIARWDGARWQTFVRKPFSSTVFTFLESSDGSFWVGCVNGIYRWTGSGFREYGRTEGIEDNSLGRLALGANDDLYATTKSGIYRYDSQQDYWQSFPDK